MMKIKVISIGTELLQGKENRDISIIGEMLLSIGLFIETAITVGDDRDVLEDTFKQTLDTSDIIITTGGLGATFDDFTKEVIAKILKRKLLFDRNTMHQIASYFVKRNIEMPKENERQAYIIQGAKIIENNVGTAPGMVIEYKEKLIILLPGPPKELTPMLKTTVIPLLKERFERGFLLKNVFHIVGLTETEVNSKIEPIVKREKGLKFSILAHPGSVDIIIVGQGENELLLDSSIKKLENQIENLFPDNLLGKGTETIETKIRNLLSQKGLTLSVAESCTGGLVSNKITNVAGSSLYFKGTVIAYSNELKINLLGVKEESIKKFGAVSKETALEMASGIRNVMKSDIGLSVTGIAGPGGGTHNKPVGLVYIAYSDGKTEECRKHNFTGDRLYIKQLSTFSALTLLWQKIK